MVVLRTFRPSDIENVKRLAERCLGERYDPGIYSIVHQAYPGLFMVAHEGIDFVGFIMSVPEGDHIRILMLCVHERHRRKGIGGKLLQETFSGAMAYGFKRMVLEVRVDNFEALEFYRSHNFVIEKMLTRYYTTGDDAYRMSITME